MFRFQIIQDKNLFLLAFFFLYYYGLGLASLDAFLSLKMWEPLKLFEMEEIDRAQFWVLCRSVCCQKESLFFQANFFRKSDGPAFFTPSQISWMHHPAFYGSTSVKKKKRLKLLWSYKIVIKTHTWHAYTVYLVILETWLNSYLEWLWFTCDF